MSSQSLLLRLPTATSSGSATIRCRFGSGFTACNPTTGEEKVFCANQFPQESASTQVEIEALSHSLSQLIYGVFTEENPLRLKMQLVSLAAQIKEGVMSDWTPLQQLKARSEASEEDVELKQTVLKAEEYWREITTSARYNIALTSQNAVPNGGGPKCSASTAVVEQSDLF